ncbi:hypothetical protein OROGR_019237 [Orobanche gracilis]
MGVANYTRSINIIHYMGACYGHVNESEYDQLRRANVIYNENDVEKELRSFFPKIILELFQTLYGYAVSISYKTSGEKSYFMEALKDLSSCCFKTICIEHFDVRELLHFASSGFTFDGIFLPYYFNKHRMSDAELQEPEEIIVFGFSGLFSADLKDMMTSSNEKAIHDHFSTWSALRTIARSLVIVICLPIQKVLRTL